MPIRASMRPTVAPRSIAILAIVASVAFALAVASYQYSTSITSEIAHVAASDIQSNAKIQAHDLSRILVAKGEAVDSNLRVISGDPAFNDPEIIGQGKQSLARVQNNTGDLTDFYMWLDGKGRLVWRSNIDEETYNEIKDTDLSYRTYFTVPRDTGTRYHSTAIVSNDNIPRIYLAAPVMRDGEFHGVITAGIRLEALGKYLESQLSPEFQRSIGMIDRKGIILYSANATFIGKDVFGDEFQSVLPDGLKPEFSGFLRQSLSGGSGMKDFTYDGQTGTLAYQTVAIDDQDFAVIYVTQPHNFASNVLLLIDQQRNFSAAIIIFIGVIAAGIAVIVLFWNSRLGMTVKSKTTELEEAVASLKSANEQLKHNDRMQTEFINIAAHELRTPIQPILAIADMISEDLQGKEKTEVSGEAISIISRNAGRLQKLSSDILDATRIEGQTLKLQKEQIDLAGLAARAIKDARKNADSGVNIILGQAAKGAKAAAVVVEADRGRIEQVIVNLINNAVRFTQSGIVTVTVGRKQDGYAEVAVSDTGRGIDPEIMPRLFMKFASNMDMGGTGLGLYISKSIVEAHGGRIWAENNANGKGATFTFTLPANGRAEYP